MLEVPHRSRLSSNHSSNAIDLDAIDLDAIDH